MVSNWLGKCRAFVRHGKFSWKTWTWEKPHHFLTMFIWVALKENARSARILWIVTEVCSNQGFLQDLQKNCQKQMPRWNLMPKRYHQWSYDMEGHAKKCVERYCELTNKTTEKVFKVAAPCMDDHQFKEEENWSFGELSTVCSEIVVKCLHLARIGRPDILWSVNELARAATKWSKACDKRLAHLVSYIHHTCEFRQYCYVENIAKQCRSGLFQDSDFARDLEDSKSTSGGILCIFGSHTFVPISWMCEKQTSVSHSFTKAEVISLDAGLRMDGIPALGLWDLLIEVFHSLPNQTKKTKDVREPRWNLSVTPPSHKRKQFPTTHTNLDLINIDHVPSNGTHSLVPMLCCVPSRIMKPWSRW